LNNFTFKLSLRFFGHSFDPSDVSAELGLVPHVSHKVGEQRRTLDGAELPGKYDKSYWTARLAPLEDENPSEALERTIAELYGHKAFFQAMHARGGRAEFFIGWFSAGNSGDTLPWDLLGKLAELKIDLALDVYGSESAQSDD